MGRWSDFVEIDFRVWRLVGSGTKTARVGIVQNGVIRAVDLSGRSEMVSLGDTCRIVNKAASASIKCCFWGSSYGLQITWTFRKDDANRDH
ncbi:hypothetical protein FF2_007494 [Malus domestica]